MALITARGVGKRARKVARVVPARIETRTVSASRAGATIGAISANFCGLTPSRTSAGTSSSGKAVRVRIPGAGAIPLGRTTVISRGSAPAASQPSSIAPAMLPQPIRKSGPGRMSLVMAAPPEGDRSQIGIGLDQGDLEGFAGSFLHVA